jgi:hypothetical protein
MATTRGRKAYQSYDDLRLYPGIHLNDERRRALDEDAVEAVRGRLGSCAGPHGMPVPRRAPSGDDELPRFRRGWDVRGVCRRVSRAEQRTPICKSRGTSESDHGQVRFSIESEE